MALGTWLLIIHFLCVKANRTIIQKIFTIPMFYHGLRLFSDTAFVFLALGTSSNLEVLHYII